MASVANVEVEPLKLSLAVVESECRKDGYYLAIVKEGDLKGSIISVKSKNGMLFRTIFSSPISEMHCDVLINTRVDEMYIANYFENSESS